MAKKSKPKKKKSKTKSKKKSKPKKKTSKNGVWEEKIEQGKKKTVSVLGLFLGSVLLSFAGYIVMPVLSDIAFSVMKDMDWRFKLIGGIVIGMVGAFIFIMSWHSASWNKE